MDRNGWQSSWWPRAALVAALLASPAIARAADRVAVFTFEGTDLPKAVEMAPFGLSTLVARRLEANGFEVIEPVLTLRDMVVALACDGIDGKCGIKMAAHNKVTRIVVGELAGEVKGKSPVKRVRVKITVFDAKGGTHTAVNEVLPAGVAGLTGSFDRLAELALVAVKLPGAGGAVPAPAPAPTRTPSPSPAPFPPAPAPPVVAPAPVSPPGDGSSAIVAITPPPEGDAGTRGSGGLLRWVGVGALGAGVVLGAVSVVMLAREVGAGRDFDTGVAPWVGASGVPEIPTDVSFEGEHDLCRDGPEPLTDTAAADLESAGVFDACTRMRSGRTIALVTGSLGVVMLAVGGVLLFVGGGSDKSGGGADGLTAVAPGVHVALDVGPGLAGARLAVDF